MEDTRSFRDSMKSNITNMNAYKQEKYHGTKQQRKIAQNKQQPKLRLSNRAKRLFSRIALIGTAAAIGTAILTTKLEEIKDETNFELPKIVKELDAEESRGLTKFQEDLNYYDDIKKYESNTSEKKLYEQKLCEDTQNLDALYLNGIKERIASAFDCEASNIRISASFNHGMYEYSITNKATGEITSMDQVKSKELKEEIGHILYLQTFQENDWNPDTKYTFWYESMEKGVKDSIKNYVEFASSDWKIKRDKNGNLVTDKSKDLER